MGSVLIVVEDLEAAGAAVNEVLARSAIPIPLFRAKLYNPAVPVLGRRRASRPTRNGQSFYFGADSSFWSN